MPPEELDRRFEAIVFDWDGTAVPNRQADARQLRDLVEQLSAGGLDLYVVTGTHVGNVDGQLGARPARAGHPALLRQPRLGSLPRCRERRGPPLQA